MRRLADWIERRRKPGTLRYAAKHRAPAVTTRKRDQR